MDFTNKQALFILTGYNYNSVEEFENKLSDSTNCSNILKDFESKKISNVKINGIPIPKSTQTPIIAFYHKNKYHQIRFNNFQKQLEIATKIYEDNNDYLSNILLTFAQLKLQELRSLEVNFMVFYDKGNDRLCFFNEQINDKLNIFSFNEGFHISLPIDMTNQFGCKAEYIITKPEYNEYKNKHIYVIEAKYSFPFNTDIANTQGRVGELEDAINKIPSVYEHYIKTCEEIIKLCH